MERSHPLHRVREGTLHRHIHTLSSCMYLIEADPQYVICEPHTVETFGVFNERCITPLLDGTDYLSNSALHILGKSHEYITRPSRNPLRVEVCIILDSDIHNMRTYMLLFSIQHPTFWRLYLRECIFGEFYCQGQNKEVYIVRI